ncbi:brefeldin A-inhibited guanine nucleotide-exchange 2-like, partial [Haematococcus lacustris]
QSAAKEFPALPDLVPRTATALSDPVLTKIVNVMRLAIQTERPNIIEVALDCLQKLIAFRFMQGAVYALNVDKSSHDTEAAEPLPASDPSTCTPQAQAIELMCRCDEIPDETVELHILKGLLTATTASSFTVHGQALLLAVRTCYNIYLMSRSEVNQTTAKASLTQMLNVVFQRLEADAIAVEVRPVVLSDVLGLPRNASAGPQDAATVMAATVQSFLNNVIMVSGGMLGPTPQELRDSVAGAFQHDRQQPTQPAAGGTSSGVQPSPASLPGSLQPAVPEEQASSGSNPPAAAQAGTVTSEGQSGAGAGLPDPAQQAEISAGGALPAPGSGELARAAKPGGLTYHIRKASEAHVVPGSLGGFGLGLQAGHGAQRSPEDQMRTMVLEKDAFLVFRALCKLSIRTSDTATAQDPTAVRGKVLALELIKVLLENSGLKFRRSDMYLNAIRQYLCVSLLKNSGSSVQAVLQLSCSIFLTLMSKFRTSLKAEPFETASAVSGPPSSAAAAAQSAAAAASAQGVIPTAASLLYKSTLLRVLNEMCRDGQLLVDLFVNYDCDLDSLNLFERMVNGLVRTAQQPVASPPPSPLIVDPLNLYHQEMFLRHEALQSLVNLVEAMLHWYRLTSGLVEVDLGMSMNDITGTGSTAPPLYINNHHHPTPSSSSPSPAPAARPPTPTADAGAGAGASGQQPPAAAPAGNGTLGGGPSSSNLQDAGGDELGAKRAYKARFQEGIALFNKKPKKGGPWGPSLSKSLPVRLESALSWSAGSRTSSVMSGVMTWCPACMVWLGSEACHLPMPQPKATGALGPCPLVSAGP